MHSIIFTFIVIGSPAGGLGKEISSLTGVFSPEMPVNGIQYIGILDYQTSGIFSALPNTFPIFQPFTQNTFSMDFRLFIPLAGRII